MTTLAVRAEGLSKHYRIGRRRGYNTLSEALANPFRAARQWQRRRGDGSGATSFWALRDVSFEVARGEVLGIVGANGAGKSTLLKILSRITKPTSGRAQVDGRVGSLLEVGTGFHPELTGRENVYLNGAILGMRRSEIDRKFDEIVAFAGVESFLDTPVKRYSSGMYLRLAFSVAAHLEPDILIVDEVLAVGDAEFQAKCLGKMRAVASADRRTVIFVSHSMDAITRLCSRSLLLERGRLAAIGDSDSIVQRYLAQGARAAAAGAWVDLSTLPRGGSGEARFVSVRYHDPSGAATTPPHSGGPVQFELIIESDAERAVGSLAVILQSQAGAKLVNADTKLLGEQLLLRKGENRVTLGIRNLHLTSGSYVLGLWLADMLRSRATNGAYDYVEAACDIEVADGSFTWRERPLEGTVSCEFDLLPTE